MCTKGNLLRRAVCFVLAVVTVSGCANADLIKISGGFSQINSTPSFGGSFTMTFNATGLPVADPPNMMQNPSILISNVDVTVSFNNGSTDSASDGSGKILSGYSGPKIFDYLQFNAGNISGYFALADKYTGNGGVLLDDNRDSSLIEAGSVGGYLNSPSSEIVVAPEPSGRILAGTSILIGFLLFGTGKWSSRKA